MVASSVGQSDSSPGGLAFSCNRSIPLNLRHAGRIFDHSAELEMFVFALKTGSICFVSNIFEFELDNPVDNQEISDICFAAQFGIVITVSAKLVQVWDIFREVVGMRIKPVHAMPVPSKPRCVHVMKRDNSCFIGLESGKIMVMDLSVCASGIPRYVCTPYLELSTSSLTVIEATLDEQYMLVGTDEGVVKVIKYDSKKIVLSTKPPPAAGAVSFIFPISTSNLPSFLVTFKASKFIAVYQDGSLTCTVPVPLPAMRAYSLLSGGIIAELSDSSLHRLYGSSWSLSAPLNVFSLATKISSATFLCLELDPQNSTTVLNRRNCNTGAIEERQSIGSLSLSGICPVATVSFARNDSAMEPHLIRLANDLTNYTTQDGRRFVYEWNDGKWEGILISATNNELFFSIYSHTTQRVLMRMLIDVPPMSVISALSVTCREKDKWIITLGFSSGQIGLVESKKSTPLISPSFPSGESSSLNWLPIRFLEIPASVHSGCRIKSIDRSLFNMLVSVDTNGLICFTRTNIDKKKQIDGPAHVAIAGDGGSCFTDPKANLAYICMADGTIERMKTPKRRPDGSEDIYDSDVFEAQTIAESVPIDGEFVALFSSIGIAVRQTGIVSLSFPRAAGQAAVIKSVPLRGDGGTRIIEAKTHIVGSHCFVVILTDTSVAAFDVTAIDGAIVPVFQRSHLGENSTKIDPFFTESLHFIKWGVSITSVLFSDRVKDILAGETVVNCAQRHFGFPKIQSTTLIEEPVKKKDDKNLFSRMFKKDKNTDGILGGEELKKFVPTEIHLQEARKQLAANLDAMAKLRDNSAEMEHASSDFLKLATELNHKIDPPKDPKKKKRFGLF